MYTNQKRNKKSFAKKVLQHNVQYSELNLLPPSYVPKETTVDY